MSSADDLMRWSWDSSVSDNSWRNAYVRKWSALMPSRVQKEALSAYPNIKQGVTELNADACNYDNKLNSNHLAAIWFADVLGRLAYNGVDFVTMYEGYGAQAYSLLYPDNPDSPTKIYTRPTYYTYLLYSKYFGDQMLKSSSTDEGNLSVWASKFSQDSSKISLMVTNLSAQAQTSSLTISGFNAISVNAYQIKSLNPTDVGTNSNTDQATTTLNNVKIDAMNVSGSLTKVQPIVIPVNGSSFVYSFPPYSTTAVVLVKGSAAPVPPSVAPAPPTPTPIVASTPKPTVAVIATPIPTIVPTKVLTATPIPTKIPTVTPAPTLIPAPTTTPQPTSPPNVTGSNVIRINTGGTTTDASGAVWNNDYGVSGSSNIYKSSRTILNSNDPILYQSERWGQNFKYTLPIVNGSYNVRLKFAEIYWSNVGQRVFNVTINNSRVLSNFDILAQTSVNTAIDKNFIIQVVDGSMVIDFSSVVDNAKISSIEITPIPIVPLTIESSNGLQATYYHDMNLNSVFKKQIDSKIDFNWGLGAPIFGIQPDTFSVVWEGFIVPKYSERYRIYAKTDDGVRVKINDKLVINSWYDRAAVESTGYIDLVANTKYPIRYEYYENELAASAKLLWSSRSQAKEVVPNGQLFWK